MPDSISNALRLETLAREPMDGYSIASIEWSEDVRKTKVTISKDGKFATLTFNQSLLLHAASAGRQVANQMPASGPLIPSAGAGDAPRARERSVIERPTSKATGASLDDSAPVSAVPVSPPRIALPKPLGSGQELSEKELEP